MFFRKTQHVGIPAITSITLWVVLFMMVPATLSETPDDIWVIKFGYLLMALTLGFFITFAILMIDSAMGSVTKFITDGDKNWDHAIGVYVFGKDYACSYRTNAVDKFFLWAGNINLYIMAIAVSVVFPQTLFVTLPVAIVVGGVWCMMLLARKIYRVNKTLTNHVNDKTIHNS